MKIAISMESTCDLPKELIEKYNFEIIPYSVILGDNVVEDNSELPARIFEYVEKTKELIAAMLKDPPYKKDIEMYQSWFSVYNIQV